MADAETVQWIDGDDNVWGVPVLDVRPVTLGMVSTSKDPAEAETAMSYGGEDGTFFIDQQPATTTETISDVNLTYRTDRVTPLQDGVLFTPSAMEEKWAIFYHQSKILLVRSWQRRVHLVATVEQSIENEDDDDDPTHGVIRVTEIQGVFGVPNETPALTVRLLDYLLKSHALGIVTPLPLPRAIILEGDPTRTAMLCMSLFGRRALVAVADEDTRNGEIRENGTGDERLRSNSLIHIAAARGNLDKVRTYLENGGSPDLLAADGESLLHWALQSEDDPIPMMQLLLEHKADVDIGSTKDRATPLMNAVEIRKTKDPIEFLLDQGGANVNAADKRGFTGLHRACELGKIEAVELLLSRGANVEAEAEGGHTPLSLAQMRNEHAVLDLLEAHKLEHREE